MNTLSGKNFWSNENSLLVKISLIRWLLPDPDELNIPNLIGLVPANICRFVGVSESIFNNNIKNKY
jgi:hypothetical protein